MRNQQFAFGCGRWHLSGTYEEQSGVYEEIARIRNEMEQAGAFIGISLSAEDAANAEMPHATKLWRAKMDLVWEEYCRRKENPLAA